MSSWRGFQTLVMVTKHISTMSHHARSSSGRTHLITRTRESGSRAKTALSPSEGTLIFSRTFQGCQTWLRVSGESNKW